MSTFRRKGHHRTNSNGTTFWVSTHRVSRDEWSRAYMADATPPRSGFTARSASDFLTRNRASRGRAACLLVPNARCPVCNVPVFFYANEYGSRVYFDDVGHPWPKHPCTDNPQYREVKNTAKYDTIIRRPKGVMLELLEAAKVAGIGDKGDATSENAGWELL
jgi:hypothetical protein